MLNNKNLKLISIIKTYINNDPKLLMGVGAEFVFCKNTNILNMICVACPIQNNPFALVQH